MINTQPNLPTISTVQLIDADTDDVLFPILDNSIIDLAQLPTQNLNIEALTAGNVGSVVFDLQGPKTRFKTESVSPYAIFGDDPRGDFNGETFPLGSYTLSVTPFSEARGQGIAGQTVFLELIVSDSNPAVPSIIALQLINADNDEVLFNIGESTLLDLSQQPTQNFNIRALTNPEIVGSVVFDLQGPINRLQTESQAPYALFGDDPRGDFNPGNFPTGSYSLQVTPFTEAGGRGIAGTDISLQLNVIDGAAMITDQPSLISLYPNPGVDYLKITSPETSSRGHLEVYNSYGQKILEKDWEGTLTQTLDLKEAKRGLYVIKVIQDGKVSYRRVMLR